MPVAKPWNSMAVGAGVIVAAANGAVAYSADSGATWNAGVGSALTDNYYTVEWNGTIFCALTEAVANKAITSPDGINWSNSSRTGFALHPQIQGMMAQDGVFYIVDQLARSDIWSSATGTAWTIASSVFPNSAQAWAGLATNGTVAVAIQGYPTGTSGVAASIAVGSLPSGSWTSRTMPATATWSYVIWTGKCFFAVSTGISPGARSYDGTTWESVTIPTTVTDGGTKTIATLGKPCADSTGKIYLPITVLVGPLSTTRYLTSNNDGDSWSECALATASDRWLTSISDGTAFVSPGYYGTGSGSDKVNYST